MSEKAYKIELLVIDLENVGADEIVRTLENSKYIYPTVMSIKSRDIGEWHDDHPLNKWDSMGAEYERLFKSPSPQSPALPPELLKDPVAMMEFAKTPEGAAYFKSLSDSMVKAREAGDAGAIVEVK